MKKIDLVQKMKILRFRIKQDKHTVLLLSRNSSLVNDSTMGYKTCKGYEEIEIHLQGVKHISGINLSDRKREYYE